MWANCPNQTQRHRACWAALHCLLLAPPPFSCASLRSSLCLVYSLHLLPFLHTPGFFQSKQLAAQTKPSTDFNPKKTLNSLTPFPHSLRIHQSAAPSLHALSPSSFSSTFLFFSPLISPPSHLLQKFSNPNGSKPSHSSLSLSQSHLFILIPIKTESNPLLSPPNRIANLEEKRRLRSIKAHKHSKARRAIQRFKSEGKSGFSKASKKLKQKQGMEKIE